MFSMQVLLWGRIVWIDWRLLSTSSDVMGFWLEVMAIEFRFTTFAVSTRISIMFVVWLMTRDQFLGFLRFQTTMTTSSPWRSTSTIHFYLLASGTRWCSWAMASTMKGLSRLYELIWHNFWPGWLRETVFWLRRGLDDHASAHTLATTYVPKYG